MRTLADWSRQIDAVLRSGLRGSTLAPVLGASEAERVAYARGFTDDFGHRRAVDLPLLTWVLHIPRQPGPRADRIDVALWESLLDPDGDATSTLRTPDGPVAPDVREHGIEVWTEVELASLQALWWHAHSAADHQPRDRALSLARWLMAELQPDNGTNRPWAVATFAELAAGGDVDAAMYADTLLHNCQVQAGRADRFSCVLLLDAANRLAALSG
ncbi:MAG: hypothetical protein IPJ41_11855 [Phycisphaerales bacterium]|nr:hypothetical protein [Phycisphaerales bacterium]